MSPGELQNGIESHVTVDISPLASLLGPMLHFNFKKYPCGFIKVKVPDPFHWPQIHYYVIMDLVPYCHITHI